MAPSLSLPLPASKAGPLLGFFTTPPKEGGGSSFSLTEGFFPWLVLACRPGHLLHFANQCWRETSRLWAIGWGFP